MMTFPIYRKIKMFQTTNQSCFFFESPGFSYTDMIDMIYAQYMQVVGLRETV